MPPKKTSIVKRTLCWCLVLSSFLHSTAQGIAIGHWRDHLPYHETVSLAESSTKIYCASPYDIFILNKSDQSIKRLSKINGLSDIGINIIRYDGSSNTLVVGYSNGNLDLLQNDVVYNMADIKRSNIISDKGIYNVLFIQGLAYLSCGFGIVVLDINKREIKDTYLIGNLGGYIKVNDIAADNSFFFAATDDGIYKAKITGVNLADFNNWQKQSGLPVPDGAYNIVEFFNNKIYINYKNPTYASDSVYEYNNGNWSTMGNIPADGHNDMRSNGNEMVFSNNWRVDIYNKSWNNVYSIWTYESESSPRPAEALLDSGDTVWVADREQGLVKNWKMWNNAFYQPPGPASINAHFITSVNGKVWVAPGGISGSFGNLWNRDGISVFDGADWSIISNKNTPELDSINDIVAIAIDPQDEKRAYCGTMGSGIIELYDGSFSALYDDGNSALQSMQAFHWIGVTKLLFDNNATLWATNTGITSCLVAKEADGNWHSYDFSALLSGSKKRIRDLAIDHTGQKWVALAGGEGILLFNDNNTLVNTNDDQSIVLNTSVGNGGLPSSEVYCISVDLDGEVWVGTDKGIAVFYSPDNVFSGSDFDAEQILVQQDGYTQILMETELVTCIAIDGANRKWIGTQNSGVFLMSANGTEEIYHFTEDNSPLFSDDITSISIDKNSGEVFFGTSKGMLSFRGTATEGSDDFDQVTVFPNPVRPDFDGLIAIKGLVTNASVKITNVNGSLVYQTTAQGGQATWNGTNFNGEKAQTGVYLVFASNNDGSKTYVAKILFIN